jgi:hypothetical protein
LSVVGKRDSCQESQPLSERIHQARLYQVIIASQSSGKFVETRYFQNEAKEERNQLEKV